MSERKKCILILVVKSIPWCDSLLQSTTSAGWNARVKLGKRKKNSKRVKKQVEMRKNIEGKSKQKDKFALCMTPLLKQRRVEWERGEGSEMKPIRVEPGCQQYVDSQYGALFVQFSLPTLIIYYTSTHSNASSNILHFLQYFTLQHAHRPICKDTVMDRGTEVCMRRWAFTHVKREIHRNTHIHIWYTGLKHDTVYLGSRLQNESPRNLSFLS